MATEILELEVKSNVKGVVRDVDSLTDSLKKAKDAEQKLNDEIKAQNQAIKDNTKEQKKNSQSLMNLIGNFRIMGVSLNSIKRGFYSIIPAIKGMFTFLKANLAASGIGLLVIAMGSLLSMSNTVKKAIGKLGGVFSSANKDMDDWRMNMDKFNKDVKFWTDEMKQSFAEAELEYSAQGEKLLELNAIIKDNTKTEAERIQAVRDAASIEQDLLSSKTMNLHNYKLALQEELDELKEKDEFEHEYSKEAIALRSKLMQMETESNKLHTEYAESEIQQAEDIAAIKQEAVDKKKQQDLDDEKAAAEKEIKDAKDAVDAKSAAAALQDLKDENFLATLENDKKHALELLTIQKRKEDESLKQHENYLELKKELDIKYTALEAAIHTKAQKDQDTIDDALVKSKLETTKAIGGAIGALGGLLKEGTAGAKAAALAEIAINTGVGIVQGLNIAQKSAKATGPAAALAFPLFYAAQLAAVLGAAAQAKQILGAGGGAGGGVPSPSSGTPAPQMMSGAFELTGGQEIEPTRAYVVSDDITANQNKLAIIRRRATI